MDLAMKTMLIAKNVYLYAQEGIEIRLKTDGLKNPHKWKTDRESLIELNKWKNP